MDTTIKKPTGHILLVIIKILWTKVRVKDDEALILNAFADGQESIFDGIEVFVFEVVL